MPSPHDLGFVTTRLVDGHLMRSFGEKTSFRNFGEPFVALVFSSGAACKRTRAFRYRAWAGESEASRATFPVSAMSKARFPARTESSETWLLKPKRRADRRSENPGF